MRLLLDTPIALWAILDDARLSAKARALIENAENAILVSAASIWEIAIKHTLARSNMPLSGSAALGFFREAGYELVAISATHATLVNSLPAHHTDPFDRLLIAQAKAESARFVTHDKIAAKYGDYVLMV